MRTDTRKKWQRAATLPKLEIIRQNLDKSDAEIGRMLGMSRSAVHALRKWHKIAKVHSATQRQQRQLEKIRGLPPGLSAEAVAVQLGLSEARARTLGPAGGLSFHWQERRETFPVAEADAKACPRCSPSPPWRGNWECRGVGPRCCVTGTNTKSRRATAGNGSGCPSGVG